MEKAAHAVLVAASQAWKNYRHQADVLGMYQYLKRQGYDDDHIVLIMADDIVYDKNNPYPGQVIRDNVMMENLYENVVVDYKLEEITPSDLKKILLGQKS